MAKAGRGLPLCICLCKSAAGRCIHRGFLSFDVSPYLNLTRRNKGVVSAQEKKLGQPQLPYPPTQPFGTMVLRNKAVGVSLFPAPCTGTSVWEGDVGTAGHSWTHLGDNGPVPPPEQQAGCVSLCVQLLMWCLLLLVLKVFITCW